jgi:glycosyltransferase involved in cell wall biosynthesis
LGEILRNQGLLVYIPTYNRPDQLSAQLAALIPQIEGIKKVRIVVSDNNSDRSNFAELSDKYKDISNLKMRRNFGNVGANANFLLAYSELEQGEYLWLLADDTLIAPNAIEELVIAITSDADLIGLATPEQDFLPRSYNLSNEGMSKILTSFSWGLISSAIYKGDYLKDSLLSGFYYHNSSFPHLAILFESMNLHGNLQIHWIDSHKIHSGNSVELSSDYSLSVTGMPQLFDLAPKWERRSLSVDWLIKYGGLFFSMRQRNALNFETTYGLLVKNAGQVGRALLLISKIEFLMRKSALGRWIQAFILKHPRLLQILSSTRKQPYKIE